MRIILTVAEGNLKGRQFTFDGPRVVTVGRSEDCDLRLPGDPEHLTVSRHHLQLSIDPPDIRVRDCGSRNGTYVNGVKIGQREKFRRPEDVYPELIPQWPVRTGDEIRLGDTALRVEVSQVAAGVREAATVSRKADPDLRAGTGAPAAGSRA
jgi:pSer/pThr/pTyr-binding forkhead associated (FHA) protein